MILDLCQNSQLQSQVFDALRKISFSKIDDFNDLIGNVSGTLSKNVDWWVEQPASRNTLQSPLFYRFCCIHLIIELIHSGTNIEKVIVDSAALFKIIKELKEKEDLRFEIDGPDGELPSFQFYIRKSLKLFFKMWKKKRSQFRAAIKTKSLSTEPPRGGLILIDQFVFPNFITKDRYYNSLWDTLSSEQKQKTFFVPTLVMLNDENFEEAYNELRNCDRNFLIKEDYLNFSDLLFSLFHLFRVWFIKPPPQEVMGVNFSPLIREELLSRAGFDSALEGLLNYRFAKRLKEKSFDLSLVIDWWEGQPLDKGWNLGFNRFFHATPTIGYIGYAPRILELQLYPSKSETNNHVVPDMIYTISRRLRDEIKEKYSIFEVKTAPAFRFGHLWQNRKENERDSGSFKILLALSAMLDESVNILEQFIACGLDFEQNAIEILIKPHPTMSVEILKNHIGKKWINHFQEVEGFTPDYIRKSDLLITGMSSVGLEAVVMGVPVIVVEHLSGLAYDPIPESVPKELWRNCRFPKEIFEAINTFRNRTTEEVSQHQELSARIKKDYFEPVTKKCIENFLNL